MPLLHRLRAKNYCDQIALTPGAAGSLTTPPEDLLVAPAADVLKEYWVSGGTLFVVGGVGAAVRLIAPLLTRKDLDPAVLVLDAEAKHILPLIGGHIAGGEDLAIELAN